MPSSVIDSFTYDAPRAELCITFTTGRVYIYSRVSEEAARRFAAAFAKGVHFNRFIRDRYPAREVTGG